MKKIEMNQEVIYSLIIDDLDEVILPEDKLVLDNWRKASADNEDIYQEFVDVHMNIDKLYERRGYDPQSSWEVLEGKMSLNSGMEHPVLKINRFRPKLWLGVAASILVVFSLGYYLTVRDKYTVVSTKDDSAHVILPDGTSVNLNSSTTIRYDKKEFMVNRKLELLDGEVFVKVTNHTLPQLRIILGDVQALDIGTSFNIIKTKNKVNVVIEEGQVALIQTELDKQVLLTAGKVGIYDPATKALIAYDNLNLNYKSWVNKKFVFAETPISEVVDQLSKVYKGQIVIKGNVLKDRKLTARLQYQTLDSVIAVISASLQCKAIKTNDTYTLSEE